MAVAQLDQESVRDFVKSTGPCLTILVPPFVPGAQTAPPPSTVLKNLLDDAEHALAARNVNRREIGKLLEPVKDLAQQEGWAKGCRWSRAIFRSPEKFGELLLRERIDGHVQADERFELLPILSELEIPREFFVLKLSKTHAYLLRAGFDLEPVPLPGRIPESLNEFLQLDKPDHDRENRSATAAGNRRVRFGTGSEREASRAYLHDYYRAIDRAVTDLLTPKRYPLLLAGVEQDVALYKSVSTYAWLRQPPILGSPDNGVSDHEILLHAYSALRESCMDDAAKELAEVRERFSPSRFSDDPKAISQFAAQGRIGHLFIAAQPVDLALNETVVETIRHGGVASVLPKERMESSVAAALRY
jgi:hypothetical protein